MTRDAKRVVGALCAFILIGWTIVTIVCPAWQSGGGRGYANYCGATVQHAPVGVIAEADDERAHAPLGAHHPNPAPPSSLALGPPLPACSYVCSADASSAADPLVLLRKCKGEVRARGGPYCSVALDVIGEKLEGELDLENVRIEHLYIERSEIRGVRCIGCTFGPGWDPQNSAIHILDSVVSGSVVLRPQGLGAEIPPKLLDIKWNDEQGKCSALPAPPAGRFRLPLRIEGARISGDLDVDLVHFEREVSVRNASIAGIVGMDRATFEQDVDFHGTRAHVLSAAGADFAAAADFFRVNAERDAALECAHFQKALNMTLLSTAGIVNLRGTRFPPTAAVTLDGVHAEGIDLRDAAAPLKVSVTVPSLGWLWLVNLRTEGPVFFGRGKIDRLIVYDTGPALGSKDGPLDLDLTQNGVFPGYQSNGLDSVQLGSIEPDEASSKALDARMTPVLQFLSKSQSSLGAYRVAEKEYLDDGKTLWANHIAFCQALRKNSSFLRYTSLFQHFAPEVPFAAALLLFGLDLLLVMAYGLRPAGRDLVADARAFAEACRDAHKGLPTNRPLLRQRLLRTPAAPVEREWKMPSDAKEPATDLRGAQLAMAARLAFAPNEAERERSLQNIEDFWEAGPVQSLLTEVLFVASAALSLVKVGASRDYEIATRAGRVVQAGVQVLWTVILAWSAAVLATYVR
jgi:hypothetical protein